MLKPNNSPILLSLQAQLKGPTMTVIFTAGLILLIIAAVGATIAGAMLLAEAVERRSAVANLIGGAEALLRNSAH
jgi:hypothetical protein